MTTIWTLRENVVALTFAGSKVEVLKVCALKNFPTHASTDCGIKDLVWPAGRPVLTLTLASSGVEHLREDAMWSMGTNTLTRIFVHHLRRDAGMEMRLARTLTGLRIEYLGEGALWSVVRAHTPTGGLVQNLKMDAAPKMRLAHTFAKVWIERMPGAGAGMAHMRAVFLSLCNLQEYIFLSYKESCTTACY